MSEDAVTTPRTILFVGKPGSGKETQAELLAKKTGYKIFSTGKEFRELRAEASPLGERIRAVLDRGLLLPAWLASYLFQSAILKMHEFEGIIFEGTGRALPEAELFHEVATWLGRSYVVIDLDITDAEAIKRQVGRGREDSNTPEKVQVRLDEYRSHTAPVMDFFKHKGVLVVINGERSIGEIHADVVARLGL